MSKLDDVPEFPLEAGYSYRVFYYEGNINNGRIHVRAIVDGQYVVREWWKGKQRWHYKVESPYFYRLLWADGVISGKRPSPVNN